MSEWITDRRPTEDDADHDGDVLYSVTGGWSIKKFAAVKDGEPWMSPPKPYQPPPPDTSLAASIERMKAFDRQGQYTYDPSHGVCLSDDIDRIIEAARKWDESQKNGVTSGSHCRKTKVAEPFTIEDDTDPGDKQEPVVKDDIRVYVRGKLRGRYADVEVMKHHMAGLIEELDAANDALETQRAINDEREAWVDRAKEILSHIVAQRDDMNLFMPDDAKAKSLGRLIEDARDHLEKRGE